MARVNVDDDRQTNKLTSAHVAVRTVGEMLMVLKSDNIEIDGILYTQIIDVLRALKYDHTVEVDTPSGRKNIYDFIAGKRIDHIEISDLLNKIEDIVKKPEEETEKDLESKVPTEKLRELVEEYEKALEKGLSREKARKITLDQFKNIPENKALELIERFQKNYDEAIQKFGEKGQETSSLKTQSAAREIAAEVTVAKERYTDLKENVVVDASVELIEEGAKEAVKAAEEATEKVLTIELSKTGEGEKVSEYQTIVEDIKAKVEVEAKIDEITEKWTEEVIETISGTVSVDERAKIKQLLEERVAEVVNGQRAKVTERVVEIPTQGKIVQEAGLGVVINEKVFRGEDRVGQKGNIGAVCRQADESIEAYVNDQTTGAAVTRVRANKTSQDSYERLANIWGGTEAGRRQANDMAQLVRETYYPGLGAQDQAAEELWLEQNKQEGNYTSQGADNAVLTERIVKGQDVRRIAVRIRDSGIRLEEAARVGGRVAKVAKTFGLLEKGGELTKLGRMARLAQNFDKVVNFVDGGWFQQLSLRLGMPTFGEAGSWALGKLGFQVAPKFVENAARLAGGDLSPELLKTMFGKIFEGGVKVASGAGKVAATTGEAATLTGGAGVVAGEAVATVSTGGIAGIVIAVVTLVIGAVKEIKKLVEKAKESINAILGMMGSSLDDFQLGLKKELEPLLGKTGAGLVEMGVMVGVFFTSLGSLFTISTGMILSVIGMIIGVVLFNHHNAITPGSTFLNTGVGGLGCVKQTAVAGSGSDSEVNCNKNATVSADELKKFGINESEYKRIANSWTSGKSHVDECFNDVVRQSIDAGMDPVFALTIWLNESDASNYTQSGTKGLDFGINRPDVPAKDFNAQFSYFLKLKHNPSCPGLPDDLAWATMYLTGSCDAEKTIQGKNGHQYLQDIKDRVGLFTEGERKSKGLIIPPWLNGGGGGTDDNNEYPYTKDDGNGNTFMCANESDLGDGSQIPADPIYDDKCAESPAWCVVDYLVKNGAEFITSGNVGAAANLIEKWTNAPAGFDKVHFNDAMKASANAYYGFQCVGFAVAIDGRMSQPPAWGGSHSGWQGMIANGSSICPRIAASGAGAGDFILFPTDGWYHIVILSRLREDGSFSISQANWGGAGRMSNEEHAAGTLQSYLSGKSVLRCK